MADKFLDNSILLLKNKIKKAFICHEIIAKKKYNKSLFLDKTLILKTLFPYKKKPINKFEPWLIKVAIGTEDIRRKNCRIILVVKVLIVP